MEDKPKIIVMGAFGATSAEVARLIAALEHNVEIVTRPETVFPVIEREIPMLQPIAFNSAPQSGQEKRRERRKKNRKR